MSIMLYCYFFNGEACRNSLQQASFINFIYMDLVIIAVAVLLKLWADQSISKRKNRESNRRKK
jgi:hypothetical protein